MRKVEKSAYREVLGIINADFIHREVSYDRFNLDLFPHMINLISKGSELAIDEAEEYKDSEAGSFFYGRKSAYIEVIELIEIELRKVPEK